MQIQSNLFVQNRYTATTNSINESLQKLSSSYKINQAADDAAGLTISEKMRAQIRGLEKVESNIQDGISLVHVADSGLHNVHETLQRARELTIQAANETLTAEDRQLIQQEINEIKESIDDIANYTHFNGIQLLNVPQQAFENVLTEKVLVGTETITQSNPTKNKIITVMPGIENRVIGGYIDIPPNPNPPFLEITAEFGTISGANWPDMNIKSPEGIIFGYTGDYLTGPTASTVEGKSSTKATYSGYGAEDEKITFENPMPGRWYIEVRNDAGQTSSTFNLKSNYDIYDEYTTESTSTITIPKYETVTTVEKYIPKPLILHVGPNEGVQFKVDLSDVRTTALEIDNIAVDPYEKIDDAIQRLDAAIQKVSDERTKFGAYDNALNHLFSNVGNAKENLTKAESVLRDADMAKEISSLQQKQVLLQSANSMIVQVNQMSQGILEILK